MSRSPRGTLLATGPERGSWLSGLVTCDVLGCRPGRGAFGLVLTRQGKILTDLEVLATEDSLLLGVAPGVASDLVQYLDRFLVMDDAEIADVSNQYSWFAMHGPAASQITAEVASQITGAWSAEVDWTDEGGAALVVPRSRASEVPARLPALPGAEAGIVSPEIWHTFRIEHGLGEFGIDYGTQHTPHEAALERRAVSWNKGCYVGQEVVCMTDMRGKVRWRLTALSVEGVTPPAPGSPVLLAEAQVGEVTSSARASREGHSAVLARLRAKHAVAGSPLLIGGRAARLEQDLPGP